MVRCIHCKKLEQRCGSDYICILDNYEMNNTFVVYNDEECDFYEPLDVNNSEGAGN